MENRFTPGAILLAAGFGTRMAPLTDTRPKPLIPVGGMALIDRVLENCMDEQICDFAINAHYLGDQIAAHVTALGARYPDARFALSDERDALLDTGGGVRKALSLIPGDPILSVNTDAFWPRGSDAPIARMQALFDEGEADAVLLCAHPARAAGFRRSHDFCLAPDKSVTNDRGVPVIYTGVALLARSVFDDAPEGAFSIYDVLVRAQEAKRLQGVLLDAQWLHVGDPVAIEEAERILGRS